MRYLLLIMVGVVLWATPASSQVLSLYQRYVANSAAPGEGNTALPNGVEMCPPHADYCTGPDQAHHHVNGLTAAPYDSNVVDVHNCSTVTVCVKEADDDTTVAKVFVESVSNDSGANSIRILADFNGDGVINVTDVVGLDGDDGGDSEGDGTARQTACLYGIVGHNKLQLAITQDGDAGDTSTDDNSYVEISCR